MFYSVWFFDRNSNIASVGMLKSPVMHLLKYKKHFWVEN